MIYNIVTDTPGEIYNHRKETAKRYAKRFAVAAVVVAAVGIYLENQQEIVVTQS